MSLGRILIYTGLALIVAGLLVTFVARFTSLGRLPGDIVYRRGNLTLYFPLATSIILSLLLTAVLWLVNRR